MTRDNILRAIGHYDRQGPEQFLAQHGFDRRAHNHPMTPAQLRSLPASEAAALPTLLHALWHDAHGDWSAAHSLVDELETPDAARVHAYLHRKEGNNFNATYWYRRATRLADHPAVFNGSLDDEWTALATHLLASA